MHSAAEPFFPTDYPSILGRIASIDPITYGKTRNYTDGAVTRLSPYIARGLISTQQVAQAVMARGYKPYQIESFLQELAWRDYFQQVWIAKGAYINTDLKQAQQPVNNYGLPLAVQQAATGISAIDEAIRQLYTTGYMHNHVRMYVAALCCNIARSHWQQPARWMYYHLLDADWASNALSWQWVAGSFSSKKYVANQENINKYCHSTQRGTFLDVPYEAFEHLEVPAVLQATLQPQWQTVLPQPAPLQLQANLPVYVYNFYNLDPTWDAEVEANRVLLLEPAMFEQYPISEATLSFVLALGQNTPGLQVCTGSFEQLQAQCGSAVIHYKEHPLNAHYRGTEHPRQWLCPQVQGYYPSFFSYWKKCRKHLF